MSTTSEISRNGEFKKLFLPANFAKTREISKLLQHEPTGAAPAIPTRIDQTNNKKCGRNKGQLIIEDKNTYLNAPQMLYPPKCQLNALKIVPVMMARWRSKPRIPPSYLVPSIAKGPTNVVGSFPRLLITPAERRWLKKLPPAPKVLARLLP